MPATVYLGGHLKSFSNGELETALDLDFSVLDDVLDALWKRHPALRDRVLDEQGEIRTHVNIFVGSENVKRLNGLQTKVDPGTELHIFNAVSGG
ncbi:MAG TPA: ubiquitin-like small modifier protein 1 [Pyrinomonadaceae bacterium]|nr:ubiquitin-like small modifier protein 1 [Pyrinomonadaceae bacterium]